MPSSHETFGALRNGWLGDSLARGHIRGRALVGAIAGGFRFADHGGGEQESDNPEGSQGNESDHENRHKIRLGRRIYFGMRGP